ncbi:hypothetical protein [Singulisphaera acidiphila]|uniref:Uncharacterized protein n=1 Tax=Singulisphaera acidiphila (strain ATCC BAA-1392 / DSM 18658 / VKM B-2454 / MOB10) TaxID=886293 RepID=L0DIP9_SINAD|nr:hypothetical protein [Singulisphaera acidiphila]AGA28526.1 hypothetical protein Sinac_4329 [Singulisphaera acidiphila DSM 18658]
MQLNQQFLHRLRVMASRGAGVRAMVDEIRTELGTNDGLALVADWYFKNAFLLRLGEVRDIEGSSCLGGLAYSDEEIDRLMLPRIENTRHLWWEGPEEMNSMNRI